MTRVKVNNCVIMVGQEPPSAHHFDLIRFHLKSYNSHKRICRRQPDTNSIS
jgi:hypothetical protein